RRVWKIHGPAGRGVVSDPTARSSRSRDAKAARDGIAARTLWVRAFCASVHSRMRSEDPSSQRYGSTIRSPCHVSTTSSRGVTGGGGTRTDRLYRDHAVPPGGVTSRCDQLKARWRTRRRSSVVTREPIAEIRVADTDLDVEVRPG